MSARCLNMKRQYRGDVLKTPIEQLDLEKVTPSRTLSTSRLTGYTTHMLTRKNSKKQTGTSRNWLKFRWGDDSLERIA